MAKINKRTLTVLRYFADGMPRSTGDLPRGYGIQTLGRVRDAGLIEPAGHWVYRITPAGRAALEEAKGDG